MTARVAGLFARLGRFFEGDEDTDERALAFDGAAQVAHTKIQARSPRGERAFFRLPASCLPRAARSCCQGCTVEAEPRSFQKPNSN